MAAARRLTRDELEILPNPVLVYQQGGTLEQALERVRGIAVDPEAGRAQRDAMHPSLEPVADELRRPSRGSRGPYLLRRAGTMQPKEFDSGDPSTRP